MDEQRCSERVFQKKDYHLAAYFAKKFGLPKNNQRKEIRGVWNEAISLRTVEHSGFLSLKDEIAITWVDSDELLQLAADNLKSAKQIGFDTESVAHLNPSVLGIIQIASENAVYLLDVLSPKITTNQWNHFGEAIFNNPDIIKIGMCYLYRYYRHTAICATHI